MKRGRICKKTYRREKGFTLVELIVVLVILAILAAILIPALLGYIDRARGQEDLLNAKNCLTAIQAGLAEQYAMYGDELQPGTAEVNLIVPSKKKNGAVNSKGDVNATSSPETKIIDGKKVRIYDNPFANTVLETIDKRDMANMDSHDSDDPVVIIFGVGSNVSGSTATKHEKYTVYYMMYQQTIDSKPWFYFNGAWTNHNPRVDSSQIENKYKAKVGPLAGKQLQYYVISNKLCEKKHDSSLTGGSAKFWEYVDAFK